MSEKNYIKLTGSYVFDPATKRILKKQGDGYVVVLHDRRKSQKPVARDRRYKPEAASIHLKPISHFLYWDSAGKDVYKKIGGNFVLYSRDRRKAPVAKRPGLDRRISKD